LTTSVNAKKGQAHMMHSKIFAVKDGQPLASRRRTTVGGAQLRPNKWIASTIDQSRNDAFIADTFIGVATVEAFLSGAKAKGVDIAKLLRDIGVPADVFSVPSARITIKQWSQLLQQLITTMNDEACGLLERPTPVGTFLMVCRAFIHCKTVGQAMERFVDFYNLLLTGVSYRLDRDGKSVHFKVIFNNPDQIKNSAIAEFALVGFHRLFSWLVFELIQLDSVCVSRRQPQYCSGYERAFFHMPVQFGQSFHGISFSRSYLDLPIVRTESDLENYVARFNTAVFLPIPRTGKLSLNLRAFLLERIEQTGALPELHDAARYFGLHSRAFCRRLKEEGLSFQEIKSRVRRDIAIYHLSKSSISMEKIADHAGFSETSAFIRAFRSWTNMTPLAYRKAVSVHTRAINTN
jgi:AraC-like DNA-binding protein